MATKAKSPVLAALKQAATAAERQYDHGADGYSGFWNSEGSATVVAGHRDGTERR
jgi:hypothetical protein|tara:strand:- start:170 stop:334 length:165 start_codon:yes stop_codon:yes gene_type:complete